MSRTTSLNTKCRRRSGVAATELAVCLPAIVLLVFGAIECCSMIFLTQALHATTYEGVRVAIQRDATAASVQQRAGEILTGHGIVGGTVSCIPADPATVNPGQTVTVRVNVTCDANRISPPFIFGGRSLTVETTMAKEAN